MIFSRTSDYRKAVKRSESEIEFINTLSRASSVAQALMLLELNGYSEKVPSSIFLILFGYAVDPCCENDKLMDILIGISERSSVFDAIFKLKLFWNTAGRWIRYNYSSKDKTMYQKLSILLGIAGRKVLENNGK